MKKCLYFLICIFAFASSLHANGLFTVTYTHALGAIINGYEIENKGENPITFFQRGQKYIIHELAPAYITADSYRRIIEVTDPTTGVTETFLTRIINKTNRAVIQDVLEKKRVRAFEKSPDGQPIHFLVVYYTLVLDDGTQWEYDYKTYDVRNPRLEEILEEKKFLPGDEIYITKEYCFETPFNSRIKFKVMRQQQSLGSFEVYASLRATPMKQSKQR